MSKWHAEIKEHNSAARVVLVGTKLDAREGRANKKGGQQDTWIATELGKSIAQKMGAHGYCECSALENLGVRDVFEKYAIPASLEKQKEGDDLMKRKEITKKKKRNSFLNLIFGRTETSADDDSPPAAVKTKKSFKL